MIAFRLAAAFAVFAASSALAGSRAPAGLGNAYPQVCGAGYHTDAGGNCQPNVAEESRFCPRGTVFHPSFDGWTCDPAPPEAY
jgi:hypothetical protein